MPSLVTRLLICFAVCFLTFAAWRLAKASEFTTETILLIGKREFPNQPQDTPTSPSILLVNKKIYPLETTTTVMIQGEKWRFNYRLNYLEKMFESNLKILDSKNVVLWEDKWASNPGDMYDLLTSAEPVNTQQWVGNYFGQKLYYGPVLAIRKIEKDELLLDMFESRNREIGMNKESLAKRLTNGSKLIILSYRSAWREDMTVMAFIPEIRKFAVFSNGGY